MLDNPDAEDKEQNWARLQLIYIHKSVLFAEIPPDTKWFKVHNLTDQELKELHVFNFHEFNDRADQNELAAVAARKESVEHRCNEKLDLRDAFASWQPPILWGHTKRGPFTIIEGNRRLIAYTDSGQTGLDIPAFVGLSAMLCHWHLPDRAPFHTYDFIQPAG